MDAMGLPPPPPASLSDDPAPVESEDEQIDDSRRNWSPEVLLALAKIWRRVCRANPDVGRVERLQLVFDAFQQQRMMVADGGSATRSRKAVEDKLYAMKQMYRFIVKMNGNFRHGSRKSVPTWFELTKEERRAVRSLHRIRIPNISLEVFNVLDSVLNPNPILKLPKQPQTQQPLQQELAGMDQTTTTTIGDGQTAEILDEKRNWSHDVTLQLAKVWNQVQRQYPEQRGALLSQHVYSAFMAAVGNSNRSRKAVDDKMHSMKEMYRFIIAYEENREEGDGKLPWFDLTKPARRQIRSDNKIRVPNLSPQVFHEIDMIMRRTTDATQNNLKNPPTPLSDEIADLDSIARYPFAPTSRLHDGFSSLSTAGQDSAAVSLLNEMNSNSDDPNMVSEADYEAMRRVAAEETSEVDEFTDLQTSGSQLLTPSAVGATTNSLWLRPTKKAKTRHVPTCTPADENVVQSAARIQELVQQLQQMHEHDIEERRAHHKEQMAALHAIIRLLKPDQHATLERNL